MEPIRSTEDAEAAVRQMHAESSDGAEILEVSCVQTGPDGWICHLRLSDGFDAELMLGNCDLIRER